LVCAVTILLIATVTFALMKLAPGDPFQDEKGVPAECLAQLRHFYGLDDPLPVQYMRYLKSIFSFQFGPSLKYPSQTVNEIILQSFPISLLLGLEALFVSIPCGMIMGILSSVRHHKIEDSMSSLVAVIGLSVPSFVIASTLQFTFAFYFPLFPVARWGTFSHTVLPALALALGPASMISRLLRASILEIKNQPYIHMARTKGLASPHIFSFHILKNSCLPILSYLGPVATNILVGSFIVERVFAIPGLGQWFVNSVMNRDYPVIGGLTLFYSLLLLGIHTLIDLINSCLDPRINIQEHSVC